VVAGASEPGRSLPEAGRLSLGCFLHDVAARHGPRVALRFEDRSVSYEQLERDARRLARGLVGAGVVKGARVGVLVANRPEWVEACFAAGLLGAVMVPINTFASPDELDYILRHADVSLLLLQPTLGKHRYREDLFRRHPELASGEPGRLRCAALPQLRRVIDLEAREGLDELGGDVDDGLLDALASEVTPADDALLIYTSGTTEKPKGVLHAQRAPVIQSWRFAELMDLGSDDHVLTAQPFFWTAGIAMSLGASLAAGATLHLQEIFDAGSALATIERERITTLHAWPHQEKELAEHPDAARRDLSSLRRIRFGSPMAGRVGLEKDVWGMDAAYGLSETFTIVSALPATAAAEARHGSHGRPLPGSRIRIVDPQTQQPLPNDSDGEICVKGSTFMRGYHKQEPETYLDDDGYFRTQDAGSLDAGGELHWTGRLSGLIKTGGANVSPLEIESALANHSGLRVALAVGVPHPTMGEVLVLCAIAADGAHPEEGEIRSFLRERLAAYKVPRRVLFFAAEELSYTGTQKIQVGPLREAALRRLAAEGAEIAGHAFGEGA
jgi:fatty-acyl-CoA synthase